jgi:hypothetical protein
MRHKRNVRGCDEPEVGMQRHNRNKGACVDGCTLGRREFGSSCHTRSVSHFLKSYARLKLFCDREANSLRCAPRIPAASRPYPKNSNKNLAIPCDKLGMKSNATCAESVVLPQRGLRQQMRGLRRSRQRPNQPSSYQWNHPEKHKDRPERVVID